MKRMILLSFLVLSFPFIGYAQDKVEAPIWNIGDKWIIGGVTAISVVNADENSYTVKYLTPRDESIIIFEKSSLNRLYLMDGNTRIEYTTRNKRLFNFPLEVGKTWSDKYAAGGKDASQEYTETFTVLGWEDVVIKAGKFSAVKLEYKQTKTEEKAGQTPKEGKVWYWYSPDVKYMLKCQYDNTGYWPPSYDWELTSFELKP